MSLLHQYGWSPYFENQFRSYQQQGMSTGRVTAIFGHQHVLIGEQGILEAELSGSLLNSKETWELPKVGDWVVFMPYESQGYIVEVLPRYNELARKLPGKSVEKQVMAANIDVAFILQGLDRDFNLMRLQRYLLQVIKSEVRPVVILNKSDLVPDPASYVQQVQALGYQCSVVLTSVLAQQGLDELTEKYLQAGKTYVMLGSSGVGKSTLINALFGSDLYQTGAVSEANQKGKHTTTSRNLLMLPNGSMIIDAPGMREFGLTADVGETFSAHHPQIEELAAQCKFHDCQHQYEPGCAVVAALEQGVLPEIVYQSYLKLLKEQHRFSISTEERRRNERQFGKIARQASQFRKKRKY